MSHALPPFPHHKSRGRRLSEWLYRVIGRVIALDISQIMHLGEGDLRPPWIDPAYEVRLLTPVEVSGFAADPANDLDASFALRMTCGRDLCCGALLDGRLASYAWFALGSVEAEMHRGRKPRSGVAVSFPRTTAFVYKAFTRPEFRGQHLYPAVLAQGFTALAPRGVKQLLVSTDWSNHSALAACHHLGFHDLGALVRIAAGPLAYTGKPRLARNYGVRLGGDAKVHARVVGQRLVDEPCEVETETAVEPEPLAYEDELLVAGVAAGEQL